MKAFAQQVPFSTTQNRAEHNIRRNYYQTEIPKRMVGPKLRVCVNNTQINKIPTFSRT
jgi:hypothetical protein